MVLRHAETCKLIFEKLDADKSGKISAAELKKGLESDTTISNEEIKSIMDWLDENKDGEVSLEEFTKKLSSAP